jgi:hypothetical protein
MVSVELSAPLFVDHMLSHVQQLISSSYHKLKQRSRPSRLQCRDKLIIFKQTLLDVAAFYRDVPTPRRFLPVIMVKGEGFVRFVLQFVVGEDEGTDLGRGRGG